MQYTFLAQEFDIANDNTKNPAERLARQKQNLRRRLGQLISILVFLAWIIDSNEFRIVILGVGYYYPRYLF